MNTVRDRPPATPRRARPAGIAVALAAMTVATVALATGCAQTSSTNGPADPTLPSGGVTAAVPVSSLTCGTSPAITGGPLPDQDWAEVASCPIGAPHLASGAPAPSASPRPVTITHGDLGPLVAGLRQPDAPRSTGVCPAYLIALPTFWLVDRDDEAYQPHIPKNPCGQPAEAVVAALRGLGVT
ncbi:hypothetical protein GCM10023322_51300 [Rugosimonospora acidiphila]|uniref:Uncharacterized protein n=1 Tax=Rugosimonospora acidiphila TaxID=556531 RepID=A0ABP9S6X5_9ACTN